MKQRADSLPETTTYDKWIYIQNSFQAISDNYLVHGGATSLGSATEQYAFFYAFSTRGELRKSCRAA